MASGAGFRSNRGREGGSSRFYSLHFYHARLILSSFSIMMFCKTSFKVMVKKSLSENLT